MTDLNLDGIMSGHGATSQPATVNDGTKFQNAHGRTGPINLQLDGLSFNEQFIVIVNGVQASAVLPRHLAEQFVTQLPINQQSQARIVPSTSDGKQVLLG